MVNPFHLVSFPGKKFKLFGFLVIWEKEPKKVLLFNRGSKLLNQRGFLGLRLPPAPQRTPCSLGGGRTLRNMAKILPKDHSKLQKKNPKLRKLKKKFIQNS